MMKALFIVLRLAAALAVVVAVVAQLISSMAAPDFFFFNFFGYFTIQSNLLIAVTFVLGAGFIARGGTQPHWLVVSRGATATYLATTGVVYNLLLANGPVSDYNVPWSNDILHKWIPLFAVLEWILFGDRTRIAWGRLGLFLVYPVIWLVATLLRGQGFVPYPFLNVEELGWGVVLLYCLGIAAFIAGMSAVVIWLSRFRVIEPTGADTTRLDRVGVAR